MKPIYLFCISLLCTTAMQSILAQEQSCPYCVPGTNIPIEEANKQQQQVGGERPQQPQSAWHTYYPPIRWGAFAVGEQVFYKEIEKSKRTNRGANYWNERIDVFGIGISSQYKTREEAEQVAIETCQKNGGKNCALVSSFGNACFEFALDEKTGVYVWEIKKWRIVTMGGLACKTPQGDKGYCTVYYATCKDGEQYPRAQRIR